MYNLANFVFVKIIFLAAVLYICMIISSTTHFVMWKRSSATWHLQIKFNSQNHCMIANSFSVFYQSYLIFH